MPNTSREHGRTIFSSKDTMQDNYSEQPVLTEDLRLKNYRLKIKTKGGHVYEQQKAKQRVSAAKSRKNMKEKISLLPKHEQQAIKEKRAAQKRMERLAKKRRAMEVEATLDIPVDMDMDMDMEEAPPLQPVVPAMDDEVAVPDLQLELTRAENLSPVPPDTGVTLPICENEFTCSTDRAMKDLSLNNNQVQLQVILPEQSDSNNEPVSIMPLRLPLVQDDTTQQNTNGIHPHRKGSKKVETTVPCWKSSWKDMRVFFPPTDDSKNVEEKAALAYLKAIDTFLCKNSKEVKAHFDESGYETPGAGLRMINGDRYELFMNNDKKGTGSIDWVIRKATENGVELSDREVMAVREAIISFANDQAKRDDRLLGHEYKFQNHAIIFVYGKAKAQVVHIDMWDPKNFQFGLVCSSNAYGTSEYRIESPVVGKDCNLVLVWKDIPPDLQEKLLAFDCNRILLERYGSLLSKTIKVNKERPDQKLPRGTLLSLPGGVAHGGPKSSVYRAVLFFSGTPVGGSHYNPDEQESKSTIVSNLMVQTWTELNAAERTYLLTLWSTQCLKEEPSGLHSVMHVHLKQIGDALMKTTGRKRLKLIKALASEHWIDDNWDEPGFKYTLPDVCG
jgi:hypothetical protein